MKGTAMRQHVLLAIAAALDASGITVKALAEKVGVTPSSVYNWLWRSTPPAATRDKLPMTIKISGRGMQLETMISIGTARNVVECINLLNDRENTVRVTTAAEPLTPPTSGQRRAFRTEPPLPTTTRP
jgi:predicted transcriptional regulator